VLKHKIPAFQDIWKTLEASFKNPPDSARIRVYWFWLNGNITRDGITADHEAMKKAGAGGVISGSFARHSIAS
jgi:hypothetical protein